MKKKVQFCPKCGKIFQNPPAISRIDNRTGICPECGVKEALAQFYQFRRKDESK